MRRSSGPKKKIPSKAHTCSIGPLQDALITLPLRQSESHTNITSAHLCCHRESANQPICYHILSKKLSPTPSQFECLIITCSHQRAPLVAMTELPQSSSRQQQNKSIESEIWRGFLFVRAPGQGPCSHCCFCTACANVF